MVLSIRLFVWSFRDFVLFGFCCLFASVVVWLVG